MLMMLMLVILMTMLIRTTMIIVFMLYLFSGAYFVLCTYAHMYVRVCVCGCVVPVRAVARRVWCLRLLPACVCMCVRVLRVCVYMQSPPMGTRIQGARESFTSGEVVMLWLFMHSMHAAYAVRVNGPVSDSNYLNSYEVR